MRILMLAHRIPYPPHTGDKIRAFHIARHLARRHDLTLAFPVDERGELTDLGALREVGPELEFGRLWKPWSLVKGLASLAVGGTLSLPYFRSRGLERRVAQRSAEAPFDLVYVSSTPMAQYARRLGAPVIMDFVDVDSDKWRQYSEHRRPPVSWLYRAEAGRLQAAEAEVARWAKLCLLATSAEETLLRSFAPWARTAILQNGIALDDFRPTERATVPAAIIFTGAMDYLPNIDAVCHFCDQVLPRIRHRLPETRFYIVGLNPSRAVRRLAEIPGVVVTGRVPDVRPYYARAAVCVAPLRIGRGVQNKVLQAMAMGLPVVASTIAQRGLEAEPGRHLHVEDDPERFAAAVVTLLRSRKAQRTMGQLARAFVETHHAWDGACARLDAMIRSVVRAETAALGRSA